MLTFLRKYLPGNFSKMLLAVILVLLLIGNWLLTETLVYLPLNLISRFASLGLWGFAFLVVCILAWSIGED